MQIQMPWFMWEEPLDGDQRAFNLDPEGLVRWWEVKLVSGSVDARRDVKWEPIRSDEAGGAVPKFNEVRG